MPRSKSSQSKVIVSKTTRRTVRKRRAMRSVAPSGLTSRRVTQFSHPLRKVSADGLSEIVAGRDFLTTLVIPNATVAGSNIFTWLISPMNIVARLSRIASTYERFKFRRLQFHYVPTVAKTQPGSFVWACDLDPNDPVPTGEGSTALLLANLTGAIYSISDGFSHPIVLDSTVPYCYCNLSASAGAEVRLEYQGQVMVNWAGDTTTGTLTGGHVYIEYEIEFRDPQLDEILTPTYGPATEPVLLYSGNTDLASTALTAANAIVQKVDYAKDLGLPQMIRSPSDLAEYIISLPGTSGSTGVLNTLGALKNLSGGYSPAARPVPIPDYDNFYAWFLPRRNYLDMVVDYTVGMVNSGGNTGAGGGTPLYLAAGGDTRVYQSLYAWNGTSDIPLTDAVSSVLTADGPKANSSLVIGTLPGPSVPYVVGGELTAIATTGLHEAGSVPVRYPIRLRNDTDTDLYIYTWDALRTPEHISCFASGSSLGDSANAALWYSVRSVMYTPGAYGPRFSTAASLGTFCPISYCLRLSPEIPSPMQIDSHESRLPPTCGSRLSRYRLTVAGAPDDCDDDLVCIDEIKNSKTVARKATAVGVTAPPVGGATPQLQAALLRRN